MRRGIDGQGGERVGREEKERGIEMGIDDAKEHGGRASFYLGAYAYEILE